MINYVSNLPQGLRSGGFSGLNAVAFSTLNKRGRVNYVGPINPPTFLGQKVLSKLLRVAGFPGDFFFFSQRRLEAIARAVSAQCLPEAMLDCFHGFTPWILTKPQRPYLAWSDCTFRDYIDVYHARERFRHRDLDRIEQAEAEWLRRARLVLFTSDWAAKRAVNHYILDSSRVGVIGICGEMKMPAQDAYAGGWQFAFVATDFEAKGGRIVLAAIREVRKRHRNASLVVIGDKPSDAAAEPGVEFTGFLRKEAPEQHERYRQILGRARAVVHPTKSDIAPLLIIEAGYFGCPVISSRRFAIPELVDDGRTGLLLDDPSDVNAVTSAMNWMLEHEVDYQRMRQAAWIKAHDEHSKSRFEDRLLAFIPDAVAAHEIAVQ